jgi:hypothetical protein
VEILTRTGASVSWHCERFTSIHGQCFAKSSTLPLRGAELSLPPWLKLLITAENVADDKFLEYSFRLGVNYRNRPGDFDSSGECGHAPTVRNPQSDPSPAAGIDFACDVDCDGGGIAVNLANNDNAVIVTLDRIRIWKGKDPDEAAVRELQGGADDKMFRLDRTGLSECAALAYDRKELAAMRHK